MDGLRSLTAANWASSSLSAASSSGPLTRPARAAPSTASSTCRALAGLTSRTRDSRSDAAGRSSCASISRRCSSSAALRVVGGGGGRGEGQGGSGRRGKESRAKARTGRQRGINAGGRQGLPAGAGRWAARLAVAPPAHHSPQHLPRYATSPVSVGKEPTLQSGQTKKKNALLLLLLLLARRGRRAARAGSGAPAGAGLQFSHAPGTPGRRVGVVHGEHAPKARHQ